MGNPSMVMVYRRQCNRVPARLPLRRPVAGTGIRPLALGAILLLAPSAILAFTVLALSSGGGPAVVSGGALALCGFIWGRA